MAKACVFMYRQNLLFLENIYLKVHVLYTCIENT